MKPKQNKKAVKPSLATFLNCQEVKVKVYKNGNIHFIVKLNT